MIFVITGQTATGKTKRALQIARDYDGELINCDSRQIYKKLDIITGKDLSLTDGKFTHWQTVHNFDIGYYSLEQNSRLWLYDIVSPEQHFSAFEYRALVLKVLEDMDARGKTPIIVGGSYFYLQHLLYDILDTPVPPNPALREELEKKPTEELQQLLMAEAPEIFNSLNNSERHNRQRLIRKIEVIRAGSEVPSKSSTEYNLAPPFSEKTVSMEGYHFEDRKQLYTIIKKRIEMRLEEGAVAEVEQLLNQGYTGCEPGLQTIGYTQVIKFLKKECTYNEMIEEWHTREMQYAKRQYTFAKRDRNIAWIEV